MLFLSSLCRDTPLDLLNTYGWEPAPLRTWALVTAGDIMMVITTASCAEFNTDCTVTVLILQDPLYQFPLS